MVLRRYGVADTGLGHSPGLQGAHGAPVLFAGGLEFAAMAVLALLRLSQRRYRMLP